MIRTVTLNTGFDEVFAVDSRIPHDTGVAFRYETVASGKGVNAARTVAALGSAVAAYGLIGVADEDRYRRLVESYGIEPRLVSVDQPTRHNLTVIPESSNEVATHYRAAGFEADHRAISQLADCLTEDLRPGDILLLSGSSLDQNGRDWRLITEALDLTDVTVVLDLNGPYLANLLADLRPYCAKPNWAESSAISTATDPEDRLSAMQTLGIVLPIITKGRDGFWYQSSGAAHHVGSPVDKPLLQVGAGDVLAGAIADGLTRKLPTTDLLSRASLITQAYVRGEDPQALASAFDLARLPETDSVGEV